MIQLFTALAVMRQAKNTIDYRLTFKPNLLVNSAGIGTKPSVYFLCNALFLAQSSTDTTFQVNLLGPRGLLTHV